MVFQLFGVIALLRGVFDKKELTDKERSIHLERILRDLDPIELYAPDPEIRKIAESVRRMKDCIVYGDDDLERLGRWGLRFLAKRTIGLL